MTIFLYWIVVLLFFIWAVFILYIPLPPDIADRKKLQYFEFLLRIGNEYGGDVVEYLFGACARNSYFRFIMSLGYIIPHSVPSFVKVHDSQIAGVQVRQYIPIKRKSKAALIFIHGGGWATMRPGYYDAFIFSLIHRLGTTVFSVDYRLAPEHPFPKPIEDCEAVVEELYYRKWEDYDIDRSRISIMGDSAGGNLSAVIAQREDWDILQNEDSFQCQVLIYPVTHVFSFQSPSYLAYYKQYNGTALLNPRAMARWILLYTGQDGCKNNVSKLLLNKHVSKELLSSKKFTKLIGYYGPQQENEDSPDPFLSTFFTKVGTNSDLSPIFGVREDLPPAMIITAGYDVLRDEGIQYAKRLEEARVPTEWKHYANAFHGQCNMPFSSLRREMVRDIAAYLSAHI